MPTPNDIDHAIDAALHLTIAGYAVSAVIGGLWGKAWVLGY